MTSKRKSLTSATDSSHNPPASKKVRVKLDPEVQNHFETLKKRMKKLKKKWLKNPENQEVKAVYRSAQKAVFEFTKKLDATAAGSSSIDAANALSLSVNQKKLAKETFCSANGAETMKSNSHEAAYREARRKWKKDRKNDTLFKAMQDAKRAMNEASESKPSQTTHADVISPAKRVITAQQIADKQAEHAQRKKRLEEQRRLEALNGLSNECRNSNGPASSEWRKQSQGSLEAQQKHSSSCNTTSTTSTMKATMTTSPQVSELQAAYASAKRAWKKDRSNDDLFNAMQAAKKAYEQATATTAAAVPVISARPKATAVLDMPKKVPVRTITDADVSNLEAKAKMAKKMWKKNRSSDDLFNAMKAAKVEYEKAAATLTSENEAIAAATVKPSNTPSQASAGVDDINSVSGTNAIQVNPLASSKSLDDLRSIMQNARKEWKIDRSDMNLRAAYEHAKNIYEFNQTNPNARAALIVSKTVADATNAATSQLPSKLGNCINNSNHSGASLQKLEAAMKEARRVWKIERDNVELRAVYDAAKLALENHRQAIASVSNVTNTTSGSSRDDSSNVGASAARGSVVQLANLSFQVTEEEVQNACEGVGQPSSITWCENAEGKFNGCALLQFDSATTASNAISHLRGKLVQGRKLKAFLASGSGSLPAMDRVRRVHSNPAVFIKPTSPAPNPESCERCFVGNLSFKVEEDSLAKAFYDMGINMKNVTFLTDRDSGEFYGSSFVTFETPADAAMAVASTGMKVLGRPVNIKFAAKRVKKQSVGAKTLQMRELAPRPAGGTHKAFFGNLDYNIDEATLTKFCEEHGGKITDIRWLTHRDTQAFKGSAFVDFESVEGVDNIISKRGEPLLGRPVRIDYA